MKKTLYITNGDCAVISLQAAGFKGEFLPIRDAFHTGPLLADDDMLSDQSVRCDFIIGEQWASEKKVYQFQRQKRDLFEKLFQFDSIQLWFEHDLYDQLQLLWVLRHFHQNSINPGAVKLVVTDLFLGPASENDMHELLRFQEHVTAEHLKLATEYWLQLTSANPNDWLTVCRKPSSLFPFVGEAIERFCLEFPSIDTGLGLTAELLVLAASSKRSAEEIFQWVQRQERAVFMGDLQFFRMIDDLCDSHAPLLVKECKGACMTNRKQSITLTELGVKVLDGDVNYLDLAEPDYWLGGVHIQTNNLWCYDKTDQTFILRT